MNQKITLIFEKFAHTHIIRCWIRNRLTFFPRFKMVIYFLAAMGGERTEVTHKTGPTGRFVCRGGAEQSGRSVRG